MRNTRKDVLEAQKLSLEIKQLTDPWWKKPAYVAAFIPAVLAIGTILAGVLTGYFQNEMKLLEFRKTVAEEKDRKLRNEEARIDDALIRLNDTKNI